MSEAAGAAGLPRVGAAGRAPPAAVVTRGGVGGGEPTVLACHRVAVTHTAPAAGPARPRPRRPRPAPLAGRTQLQAVLRQVPEADEGVLPHAAKSVAGDRLGGGGGVGSSRGGRGGRGGNGGGRRSHAHSSVRGGGGVDGGRAAITP